MGAGGALLIGRAVSDHRAAGNQRRAAGLLGRGDRLVDRVGIVTVDLGDAPAAGRKARDLIVGYRQIGAAIDGNAVVVEQHDQARQSQVPGQRNRLVADALHQTAVAGEHIGKVIDHPIAETRSHHALGQRHADGVRQTLAERSGGGFDAGCVTVFGMAGGAAAELAEILDLFDRHVGVAGQIEHRVEQHRGVAVGQNEPVAVGPLRVGGIELQVPGEQHRGDVGHPHGRAGMAGIGRLDRIHGKRPDGVRHLIVADGLGLHL